MFKFAIPLAVSLLMSVSANAETPQPTENQLKLEESRAIPKEWHCPNKGFNKVSFPADRFSSIASFVTPYQHMSHHFLLDNKTQLVYEIQLSFDKDNINIIDRCILNVGKILLFVHPPSDVLQEQKTPEDKNGM